MISLLIPTHGGNPANFRRTVETCLPLCDEVVAVTTCLFEVDLLEVMMIADKVVELPWNFTYLNGFSEMHNAGAAQAKNDWLIRLDVAETIFTHHQDIPKTVRGASPTDIFQCDHVNDPTHWRRMWNRSAVKWSGIIHESLIGGNDAGLLFEMRDTQKVSTGDAFKDEVLRWQKATLYHVLHIRLRENPTLLGATDAGWLKFLEDHRTEMDKFMYDNPDLIGACLSGDLEQFKAIVKARLSAGRMAYGVNYNRTGT